MGKITHELKIMNNSRIAVLKPVDISFETFNIVLYEMTKWCKENEVESARIGYNQFHFSDTTTMTLFILRWL